MVTLKYVGTSLYVVGGYNGIARYKFEPNKFIEMKDEDLWLFMKSKTFAHRVRENIIVVPRDFPLEKPKSLVMEESQEKEEERNTSLPSLKATLRSIEESSDIDFLSMLDTVDPREKVKEAIKNKIRSLETAK